MADVSLDVSIKTKDIDAISFKMVVGPNNDVVNFKVDDLSLLLRIFSIDDQEVEFEVVMKMTI